MRIAIVNDSVMAIETLRRAVTRSSQHQIAWVAYNGADAIKHCAADRPDLILMDLMMPVMDGVEATRRIMQESPCAILIVTATVSGHATQVFEALGAGALDVVSTPAMQSDGSVGASALLYKIEAVTRFAAPVEPKPLPTPSVAAREQILVVGASAGGPAALAVLLGGLSRDLPVSILIVQHIDEQFSTGLASWLGSHCTWPVRVAEAGEKPQVGVVLVAGTNDHLVLQPGGKLAYVAEPRHFSYRPSVDVFFESVHKNWKGKIAGVLLTGMGRDGAMGLKLLRDSGALTIAQSREGCVVYGMPKAAAEMDAATQILPLEQIAFALSGYFTASQAQNNRKFL